MKYKKALLQSTLALLTGGLMASAQYQDGSAQTRDYQLDQRGQWQEVAGADQQFSVHMAGDLLGFDMVSEDGRRLGDLTDYVVRLGDEDVPFFIITQGGILGFGGTDYAIPATAVDLVDERLVANISKQRFDNLTPLDDIGEQLNDREFRRELANAFGVSMPAQPRGTLFFQMGIDEEDVELANGREIGWVEDFLINFSNAKAPYLVIQQGGFGTLGNRPLDRIAIPIAVVSTEDEEGVGEVIVDLDYDDIIDADYAEGTDFADREETDSGTVFRIDLAEM